MDRNQKHRPAPKSPSDRQWYSAHAPAAKSQVAIELRRCPAPRSQNKSVAGRLAPRATGCCDADVHMQIAVRQRQRPNGTALKRQLDRLPRATAELAKESFPANFLSA